jgi:hypothetical protein
MSTANLTTIKITGHGHIHSICQLLKANYTWHLPITCHDNEYRITLKAGDPLVSFLQLKYNK